MRRIISGALAALALAAATACASGSPQPFSNDVTPRPDEIVLHVVNHNINPVTVRVLTGLQNIRLGTVEANREDDFIVPPTLDRSDLRFAVLAIGADESFVTEPLSVAMGSTIHMDVKEAMALTDVRVTAP